MDMTTANECRAVSLATNHARAKGTNWSHHLSIMEGWLSATLAAPVEKLSDQELDFLATEENLLDS